MLTQKKNEGDGRMGLLLLASVPDQIVCGTKAAECQVWISWINTVKPWIKSYSGREFYLAYGKQHPLLIQSGSWNTGSKYISFFFFIAFVKVCIIMLDYSKSFPVWVRLHLLFLHSKQRYQGPTHTLWHIFGDLNCPHELKMSCSDHCGGLGNILQCGVLSVCRGRETTT